MSLVSRIKRIWALSKHEPKMIIGGQAFEQESEIVYPEYLAEKQKAQFIAFEPTDPIKQLIEETP